MASVTIYRYDNLAGETFDDAYARTQTKPDGVSFYSSAQEFAEDLVKNASYKFSKTEAEDDQVSRQANQFRVEDTETEDVVAPKAKNTTKEEMARRYPYLDARLVDVLLESYTVSQNMTQALADMRANPLMEAIYPGIRDESTGQLRMTEVEYLTSVDTMSSYLRDYNLNPSEFSDDIVAAIAGNVSPDEFGSRLELGYEGIVNNIPEVKAAYLENFGIEFPDEADRPTLRIEHLELCFSRHLLEHLLAHLLRALKLKVDFLIHSELDWNQTIELRRLPKQTCFRS